MNKDTVKDLKKLKVGEKILLIKSNNGYGCYDGKIGAIVCTGSSGNYTVELENKARITVYNTNPADIFALADRKEQAKFLRKLVEEKKEEIKKMLMDIEFLEKYETEEDFVADKLLAVINAKDRDGIVKILKEMKSSNMI